MDTSTNATKQILYITYDGLTDPLGQSQVLPYIKGLCKQGYQYTILSFEKQERLAAVGDTIRQLCKEDNIDWHPVMFHTKPPVLAKIYDRWKMKQAALQLHKQKQFSFIHCRSYPGSEVGLYFALKYKVPFLFDMRGFWPDEKIDSGHWNTKRFLYRRIYKHYKKKELAFLQNAAHIISLTHAGKQELHNKYNQQVPGLLNKITVIPTCADLDLFDYNRIDADAKAQLQNTLGLKDKFVVSYSGSVGGWYLINEMLAFIKVIKQTVPNVVFLCLTKEPQQEVLRHLQANGLDASDVVIKFANRAELPLYLSLSNLSVFFIRNTYSKISSSPTKYPELMGLGIPVICNDIGDTGHFVTTTQSGIVVNEFNEAAFKKAITDFFNTSFSREHIRNEAKKYFDLQTAIKDYSGVYAGVLYNKK